MHLQVINSSYQSFLEVNIWPSVQQIQSNATGHLTQAHLKIYTRMTKKEEGYGVAIVQSKSKPHPDGNAETGHCKTCAQITTNL